MRYRTHLAAAAAVIVALAVLAVTAWPPSPDARAGADRPATSRAVATRPASAVRPRVYFDLTCALYAGNPGNGDYGLIARYLGAGSVWKPSNLYPLRVAYSPQRRAEAYIDDRVPIAIDDEEAPFNYSVANTAQELRPIAQRLVAALKVARAKAPNTPVTWMYSLPNPHPDFGPDADAMLRAVSDQCDFIICDTSSPDHSNSHFDQQLDGHSDLIAAAAPELPQVMMMCPWADMTDAELERRLRKCLTHPRCSGVLIWVAGGTTEKQIPQGLVDVAQRLAAEFNGDPIPMRGAGAATPPGRRPTSLP